MRKLEVITAGVVMAGCVSALVFSIKPNAGAQLFGMAALAGLLILTMISFFWVMLRFKRVGFRALPPSGICLAGFFINVLVAPSCGGAIRLWNFHHQLPRYAEVVWLVESGKIKLDASLTKTELPPAYAKLAVSLLGKMNSSGEIILEFIIGSGFPVKHSGYLYMSGGEIESDPDTLRRWPKHRKLEDKWFAIGD